MFYIMFLFLFFQRIQTNTGTKDLMGSSGINANQKHTTRSTFASVNGSLAFTIKTAVDPIIESLLKATIFRVDLDKRIMDWKC